MSADNPFLQPGATSGTKTTTLDVVAPAGLDTFVISDFDAIGGAGNLLARTAFSATVALDAANVIGATLDGNLANINYNAVPSTYLADAKPTYTITGGFGQTFNLVPRDASNNIIIAPGAIPRLTLKPADASSIYVTSTANTNQYTVSALKPDASVLMTAAGTDLDGAAVTTTFTVKTLGMIYVLSAGACVTGNSPSGTSSVTAYSEAGVQIALPAGAFSGIYGCTQGLMYAPPTAGSPAQLYVAYTDQAPQQGGPCPMQSNPAPPPVPFDLLGAPVTIPTCQFTYWADAAYSRFAPSVGSNGEFLMVGSIGGQIFHEYDPAGNLLDRAGDDSPGAQDFYSLLDTTSVAVDTNADANAGQLYFTNKCFAGTPPSSHPCSLQWYKPDGTLQGEIDVGNSPNSLVFDPNNSQLYVTNINGSSAAVGLVGAYTETLGTAIAGPFGGLMSADDIAFDIGNKTLYITDHLANAVKAFAENGTPATGVPATGAFANLSNPHGIVVVP